MKDEQDDLYTDAVDRFGAALGRLARASEVDAERRRDLLQEMHVALWRSFAGYDRRCSMRTWVYRVAHNIAATHAQREKRDRKPLVPLEHIEPLASDEDAYESVETRDAVRRLHALIRRLKQPDRQVVTLYLEGLAAAEIAEVTGLSAGAVAARVHRAKALLARMFHEASDDA